MKDTNLPVSIHSKKDANKPDTVPENLPNVVDEYLHWRKVNPQIKGGENYLKRLREVLPDTLNDCRAAFEAWWGIKCVTNDELLHLKDNQWSAWQAAWNQRPSEISGKDEPAIFKKMSLEIRDCLDAGGSDYEAAAQAFNVVRPYLKRESREAKPTYCREGFVWIMVPKSECTEEMLNEIEGGS